MPFSPYTTAFGGPEQFGSLMSRTTFGRSPGWGDVGTLGNYFSGGGDDRISRLLRLSQLLRGIQVIQPASTGSGYSLNPEKIKDALPEVAEWMGLIRDVAGQVGIPPNVIAAIMSIESSGNPNATSPAGAKGLMQVMPFHFSPGENPFDPRTNVFQGARILQTNYQRYGDWDKAAAAYFGAISPEGSITGARDVSGTSGNAYVARFRQALQAAGGLGSPSNENYSFPIPGFSGAIDPHWGVGKGAADLFASSGTPVFSVGSGTVTHAGFDPIGGYNVLVQGNDGRQYYYAHLLEAPYVTSGQKVNPGLTIGKVGTSGNARNTPPHLHLGIGSRITLGSGPFAGSGTDFNTVEFLRGLLG